MRVLLLTLVGIAAVGTSGCSMCSPGFLDDYATVGGKWQRSDPTTGRVGSIFSDAGSTVGGEEHAYSSTTAETYGGGTYESEYYPDEYYPEGYGSNEFQDDESYSDGETGYLHSAKGHYSFEDQMPVSEVDPYYSDPSASGIQADEGEIILGEPW